MSAQISVQKEEGVLQAERTLKGRLVAAVILMSKIFPVAMGAFTVFFIPDLLFGDLTEKEPFTGLFWLSLVGISMFITGLSGIVRFFRRERWIFDGPQNRVVAEVTSLFGSPAAGEAGLGEIKKLQIITGKGLRQSRLSMVLEDGAQETLFSGNGLAADLEALLLEIEEYLKEQRYFISVERSSAGS